MFCLALCLFEGNYQGLLVKNEMKNPENFMKISSISILTYGFICMFMGAFGYLAMGNSLTLSLSENQIGKFDYLG
jgi:amino acid permease